jgi:antitoxin CcdA
MRDRDGVNLRGMWPVAPKAVRRAVNIGVSSDLLAQAREASVNLSSLFERALLAELKQVRCRRWREENARAAEVYNENLTLHGACFEGRWGE